MYVYMEYLFIYIANLCATKKCLINYQHLPPAVPCHHGHICNFSTTFAAANGCRDDVCYQTAAINLMSSIY